MPAVVVGVVGMGHVPGIERNWDKELNIHEIMRYVPTQLHVLSNSTRYIMPKIFVSSPFSVAPPSRFGWVVRKVLKGAMWGLLGYACFRASKGVGRALLSLQTVQSLLEKIRTPSVWPFFYRHRLFSNESRMSHWTPTALTTGWWLGEAEN